jgi:tetratricopeptide (TPR) repeat protein
MVDEGALMRAQELYSSARLAEAETLLRDVIHERPHEPVALRLLGFIAGQTDRPGEAIQWLERARDADPGSAAVWQGLGLVYRQLGRLDMALAAYERCVALDPNDAVVYVNYAVALKGAGRLEHAMVHLQRAIALQPRLAPAYVNLGNCRMEQGDLEQAGASYVEAVKIDPCNVAAILGLAKAFREQRRFELAEKTLRAGLKTSPGNTDIQATLGALAHDMGRTVDAKAILEDVLRTDPRQALAWRYLGNVAHDLGRYEEADAHYRRALEAAPDDADTHLNRAGTLGQLGRRAATLEILEDVRRRWPGRVDVRYHCALALLNEGEFESGWAEYAWRTKIAQHRTVRFAHLPRLAEPIFAGRKVILWGDQGIGDEIVYGSFLLDLRSEAPRIVCELDGRLLPLFRRGFPEVAFVARSPEPKLPANVSDERASRIWAAARLDPRLTGATHQIALPDLGRWLRPDFARFPRHAGYLRPDASHVEAFRRRLVRRPAERLIGLSWRSRHREFGGHKSIDLRAMLASVPSEGVRLVNLQYGDVREDVAEAAGATGRTVEIVPDLDHLNDIDGLAALVSACDQVVTVSNVTAHLAGSLGKPAALLCPHVHGKPWYWFRDRSDSPWYPSLRLFRQAPDGSWASALEECSRWLR